MSIDNYVIGVSECSQQCRAFKGVGYIAYKETDAMQNVSMKIIFASLLSQKNAAFTHPSIYRNTPKNIHFFPKADLMELKIMKEKNGFASPMMPHESTIRSPQTTNKKKWDDFWSKVIKIDGSQTRRHIIMSSTFKKAIRSLKEHSQKNSLKKELQVLYADLLGKYYGCALTEKSLPDLEGLMFHALHNLRFNIFIGCKNWNMGISDGLRKIEETEKETLLNLEKATTLHEVKERIKDWYNQNVLMQQSFNDASYQNVRIEIQDMIELMTHFDPKSRLLNDVKKDLGERILSIADSLKVDLSQAKNDEIRKWQNSALPSLHGHLTELTENPNIDKARDIFRQALETNQKGAHVLGINLSQLEAHETKTIAFFQDAITSDST